MNTRAAIALLAAMLGGCISDLAVGMSVAEVTAEEAGAPTQEADAGGIDARARAPEDAALDATLDAASPADAAIDAATMPDAARDAAVAKDAAVDAGRDAGSWRPCSMNECVIGFTTMAGKEFEGCGDAAQQRCGRRTPEDACEWYCE